MTQIYFLRYQRPEFRYKFVVVTLLNYLFAAAKDMRTRSACIS